MKKKKAVFYRLSDKYLQKAFLHQTGEWKKTLNQLAMEMEQEHWNLSDVPIKDFSTAVLYQEFLMTTIQFIKRATETLDEYVLERLEDSWLITNWQQHQER